ncbi:MAG TPA: hypothetical protein VFS05_11405 [Gemmatimonadaceae bacterium]|nr:hypothetical protein [Gemmatimonadaceae bacterium]
MSGHQDGHEPHERGEAPHQRLRPPIGIPMERNARWPAPIAFLLPLLLILLVLAPALLAPRFIPALRTGGGGPGPAGGGGGGRRGTGGGAIITERLRYLQTAPATAQPAPAKPVVQPKPRETPPPVPPPKPPPKPEVKPEPKPEQSAPAPDVATAATVQGNGVSVVPGTGGGTGNDGTAGSGPGTGGGVGTGVGTGRGSGNGPGTGGGPGTIYPPTPEFTPLPPFPYPKELRGQTITLVFTVNEKGETEKLEFPPTRDKGYNRRLHDAFAEARFRPATRWDGIPIAAVFPIQLRF